METETGYIEDEYTTDEWDELVQDILASEYAESDEDEDEDLDLDNLRTIS